MKPEIRAILERYARSAIGEVTDATLKATGDAHPLLKQVASLLIGEVLTEGTIARLVTLFERLLVDVFGDDYPLKVDAQRVVIEDNRN